MRVRYGLLALALIGSAALFHPSRAHAIDPSALTNPQFGQVVSDRSGRLHAVWIEQAGSGSQIYYQTIDPFRSQPETGSVVVANTATRLRRPQVAVDRRGNVHLLWQERFTKSSGARDKEGTWVHYARLNANDSGREIRHEVLNDRPRAQHPDLAVDGRGDAFVVWEEAGGGLLLTKIDARTGLAAHRAIASTNSTERRAFPAIAVDRSGQIQLAWTEGENPRTDQIVHAAVDAKALAITQAKQVVYAVPAAAGQRKNLAIDPAGQLRMTWVTKQGRGPQGEQNTSPNALVIARRSPGAGGSPSTRWASQVADRHLNETADQARLISDAVALPKRISLPLPAAIAIVVDPHDRAGAQPIATTAAIEKILKQQLLRFSSWSGAPPSVALDVISEPVLPAAPLSSSLSPESSFAQLNLELESTVVSIRPTTDRFLSFSLKEERDA